MTGQNTTHSKRNVMLQLPTNEGLAHQPAALYPGEAAPAPSENLVDKMTAEEEQIDSALDVT